MIPAINFGLTSRCFLVSANQIGESGERRADLNGSDSTREMATARQELIALIDMPISGLVTSTNA